MAAHSSTPAWRIPWTEEAGGLQSMGSQRAGHDWVTEQRQPSASLLTLCMQLDTLYDLPVLQYAPLKWRLYWHLYHENSLVSREFYEKI